MVPHQKLPCPKKVENRGKGQGTEEKTRGVPKGTDRAQSEGELGKLREKFHFHPWEKTGERGVRKLVPWVLPPTGRGGCRRQNWDIFGKRGATSGRKGGSAGVFLGNSPMERQR